MPGWQKEGFSSIWEAFRDPLWWANSVSLPASMAYHPATIEAISRDSAHSPCIQQVHRDAALCKEALCPHKTEKTRDNQNGSRKRIIHICHCVFIYESFMQNTCSKSWFCGRTCLQFYTNLMPFNLDFGLIWKSNLKEILFALFFRSWKQNRLIKYSFCTFLFS